MSIALVSHVASQSDSPGNTATTGAISTLGATLLIAGVSWYFAGTGAALSDSSGNTWTPLTITAANGAGELTRLFYVSAPSVSASHTFMFTGSGIFPAICVAAFSGVPVSPFDAEAVNPSGSGTTVQPTGITPSQNNELLVTALTFDATGFTLSIDQGFTILDAQDYRSGQNFGGALAYLIQSTATAVNPTWTISGSVTTQAVMAAFTASTAVSRVPFTPWAQLGPLLSQ
jgi:hypothetical protein